VFRPCHGSSLFSVHCCSVGASIGEGVTTAGVLAGTAVFVVGHGFNAPAPRGRNIVEKTHERSITALVVVVLALTLLVLALTPLVLAVPLLAVTLPVLALPLLVLALTLLVSALAR